MQQVILYQADYTDVAVVPQATLCLSSPPVDILWRSELFAWFDANVEHQGWVVLDMPEDVAEDVREVAKRFGWYRWYQIPLHDFYEVGDVQEWCYFQRQVPPEGMEMYQLPMAIGRLYVEEYRRCTEREMSHPYEFDAAAVKAVIEEFSSGEDVVVDPFCGTGTVPRVARDMGRVGIGIDLRCPWTNDL